jgi:hypothetical protein
LATSLLILPTSITVAHAKCASIIVGQVHSLPEVAW